MLKTFVSIDVKSYKTKDIKKWFVLQYSVLYEEFQYEKGQIILTCPNRDLNKTCFIQINHRKYVVIVLD